jgi:hypothetical protein
MPTLEENMQSVRTFAEEVFGKQKPHVPGRLACRRLRRTSTVPEQHARQEGCNRLLSHLLAATADMSRHPRHDRGGQRQGCDQSYVPRHRQSGFIPGMPATGKTFATLVCLCGHVPRRARVARLRVHRPLPEARV